MRSIRVPAHSGLAAARCMLWLPGALHVAEDFLAAGFAEAVRRRGLAVDLVFVDLELDHVADRSALTRVREELVLPALAAGVSVWCGGISLGGLFALGYAAQHPDEFDGLCLLAPYLGNRILTKEIASAPALNAWQPGTLAESDEERRIWRYIRDRGGDSRPLYLGFGRQDRFAAAHALLAKTLPADRVDIIEGGHDWPTWTQLWERFLTADFI
jgi:pimeloyl-ACP methyl ester carboxylesterase